MFLNCPAYLDQDGIVRCGLPAEVRCRFTLRSTDGPIECAMIRCPADHHFNGAIESLTWDDKDTYDPGTAGLGPRAERDSLQRSYDGRDGLALRDFPAEKGRKVRPPTTAPAYYLSHPASLWITAIRPAQRGALTSAGRPAQRHQGGHPGPPTPLLSRSAPAVPGSTHHADAPLGAPRY
jgi:hypothetical protein